MDALVSQIEDANPLFRQVYIGTVAFKELRDSIETHGVTQPILVRDGVHAEYQVIDGMNRLTAARQLQLPRVPIHYHPCGPEEAANLQLQNNACRIETGVTDYARRLRAMSEAGYTLSEIAEACCKSISWVKNILGLLQTTFAVSAALDRGEMPLSNGYLLAKLPQREQNDWLERAKTLDVAAFRDAITPSIHAKTKGRYVASDVPKPHLRNLKEIQRELEDEKLVTQILVTENATTSLDGFRAALKWVTHMDQLSLRKKHA